MPTNDRRLDPNAPLPGPPDPWAETEMPSRRDGPPWHMTEMIEAEPALSQRILDRLAADGSARQLAQVARQHADAGHPVLFVGCGTSEHGALAAAAVIGEALDAVAVPAASVQAFEASLMPMHGGGLVVGISHEGGTWATIQALEHARAAGMTTALITASRRTAAAQRADIVLETLEIDQSWCHTVGYLSPIVAAVEVAAVFDDRSDVAPDVRPVLAAGLEAGAVAAAEAAATTLAALDRVVVVAGGTDQIAARELVLKIEEGTHLPAAFRQTETLLHGHLAGMDDRTGVAVIAAEPLEAAARASRLANALRAALELGIRPTAILTAPYAASIPDELTPGGRIVINAVARNVGHAAQALLATAVPLQLLTERMARVRGVNPDPIRRDDPRYLAAAAAGSPTS
ncbi:MAG TPA: SIS domain-containing protein [Candidatus Limnocylindrales bacterium]|nr:SIS domain-containing protein [Candidatus Limnocylindrales bacterium]